MIYVYTLMSMCYIEICYQATGIPIFTIALYKRHFKGGFYRKNQKKGRNSCCSFKNDVWGNVNGENVIAVAIDTDARYKNMVHGGGIGGVESAAVAVK